MTETPHRKKAVGRFEFMRAFFMGLDATLDGMPRFSCVLYELGA